MKQKLSELKEETDNSTKIVGDFNPTLSLPCQREIRSFLFNHWTLTTFNYVIKKEFFLSEYVILCSIINIIRPGFPSAGEMQRPVHPSCPPEGLSAARPTGDTLVMIQKESCVICPEALVWGGPALWDGILKPSDGGAAHKTGCGRGYGLGNPPDTQGLVPWTEPEAWREEFCCPSCTPPPVNKNKKDSLH